MTLIEGVGDDVMTVLLLLFVIVLVIISWLSTNVREYNFPANLLVIERRSRRLFTTTSLNGNSNRFTKFIEINNSSLKYKINQKKSCEFSPALSVAHNSYHNVLLDNNSSYYYHHDRHKQ